MALLPVHPHLLRWNITKLGPHLKLFRCKKKNKKQSNPGITNFKTEKAKDADHVEISPCFLKCLCQDIYPHHVIQSPTVHTKDDKSYVLDMKTSGSEHDTLS